MAENYRLAKFFQFLWKKASFSTNFLYFLTRFGSLWSYDEFCTITIQIMASKLKYVLCFLYNMKKNSEKPHKFRSREVSAAWFSMKNAIIGSQWIINETSSKFVQCFLMYKLGILKYLQRYFNNLQFSATAKFQIN